MRLSKILAATAFDYWAQLCRKWPFGIKTRVGVLWFKLCGAGVFWGVTITAAWSASYTFSNTNLVVIDDSANPLTEASPYPSAIVVTGLTGQVLTKATVTLHGFSHTFPSDVSVLLVGPQGQSAIVMSETGGQDKYSVTNLILTLDDDASNSLPVFTSLVSGAFKPTDGYVVLGYPNLPYDFPAPAPPANSNSPASLSVFTNNDPDGAWSLFVLCDSADTDSGNFSNGWSLSLSVAVPLQITRNSTEVIISWPASATNYQLQSAPSLSNSTAWSNVLSAPFLSSGWFLVTNPVSSGNSFYRLVGD